MLWGIPHWVPALYLLAGAAVAYSMLGLNRGTRCPNRLYPDGLMALLVALLWLPLALALLGLWLVWRVRNRGEQE